MRANYNVLLVMVVTLFTGPAAKAQDQHLLESARREFDCHLDEIHLELCNQSSEIRQAWRVAEYLPIRDRVLVLLRAAQRLQQAHLAIDQQLSAIPSLSLVQSRPDSLPEVERLVGEMQTLLRRAGMIAVWNDRGHEHMSADLLSESPPQEFIQLTAAYVQGGGLGGEDGFGIEGFGSPGAPQPDFQALIDLLQEELANQEVDDLDSLLVGMVIYESPTVHDEIADTLEQLRRLQDLQVTIEVRFNTVDDRFYERIGVDFDFNVFDTISVTPKATWTDFGSGLGDVYETGTCIDIIYDVPLGDYRDGIMPYVGFGGQIQQINNRGANFNGPGQNFVPNGDLDLWGGVLRGGIEVPLVNPNAGSNFGFAILSDIEAFFFLQASMEAGRASQNVNVGAFNPALPIVPLDVDSVEEDGTYVGGRVATGLGFSWPSGVSVAGVVSYGATRTNVIFDDWHTFRTVEVGLQMTITPEKIWQANRRGEATMSGYNFGVPYNR